MSKPWQLQDAKNRFSEVVDLALAEGPQTVTRHGHATVVVISVDDYRRLAERKGFKKLLRSAPLEGVALDRSKDRGRKIDLP